MTDEIGQVQRERLAAIVDDILSRPVDYEKLAAEEAARTDPWRWYCRLCGAKGEEPDSDARDREASGHLASTACGRHAVTGRAEAGRLLHVWTYGPPAGDDVRSLVQGFAAARKPGCPWGSPPGCRCANCYQPGGTGP